MAENNGQRRWGVLSGEVKKANRIAWPMVAVSVLQYLVQVVSVVMVGHLGQLSLSSVAIATSLTNVTGFSLLSGLAGGLETLCGQAYGAKQYRKLSTYTYSAIISLTLVCFPISIFWCFLDKFLIFIGQDPLISVHARKYSLWLIPGLFGGAVLKPVTRFFQMQSLVLPMTMSSLLVLCLHAPLCWIIVYNSGMGSAGAAVAFGVSTWFNVVLLAVYVVCSSACERTRSSFSKDAVLGVGEFFRVAVPSAVMVCLKWWSLEMLTLLSGLFSDPKLETSVLTICLTITTLHFTIPYGFGAATRNVIEFLIYTISTRVSNELGAGNPEAARVAVWAIMSLAIPEALISSITLFSCRHVVGYAFSDEKPVVHYISQMVPLLCALIIMDSLQVVLSGVAKGCGWQKLGAYVNIGAFYLVGLPVSVMLGFIAHLEGKGLWIGIVVGSVLQSTLLLLITAFTDWNKQACIARNRVVDNSSPRESEVA